MANDPQRLENFSLAGAYCLFDKKLKSSGTGSIVWGLLNLLIGAALLMQNDKWGAVSVVLGLALIVAGIYERSVRHPQVIIISAATLALLALWNLALIALAAMGKVRLVLGGRTLFWALAQAWGAFATWKTYHTYKMLLEKSDPLTVEQVRGYIDELKKAKAGRSLELVQFDANAGFLQATKQYRLKPIEDFFLVACYKSQLGSLQLEEVSFVPRNDVRITLAGEKWMSKKIKATVDLGQIKLAKVSITPEMASRLNPAAPIAPLGAVPPAIG